MKILITGATGFVGRTVVSYFALHAEHELCLLVRSIEKVKTLFHQLLMLLFLRLKGTGNIRL